MIEQSEKPPCSEFSLVGLVVPTMIKAVEIKEIVYSL